MDRDKRWDRVALAYAALVDGQGERAADAVAAVDAGYAPRRDRRIHQAHALSATIAACKDGDGVLMANFRADRVRQLLAALLDPRFAGFRAHAQPSSSRPQLGMTEYSTALAPFHGRPVPAGTS